MIFFFVEPSATQLIVQFLERSGLGSIILVECLLWDMIHIFFTKLSKFNILIFLSIYILASATKKVPAMGFKVVCSKMYVTDFTLCCYFNFNPCARICIDKISKFTIIYLTYSLSWMLTFLYILEYWTIWSSTQWKQKVPLSFPVSIEGCCILKMEFGNLRRQVSSKCFVLKLLTFCECIKLVYLIVGIKGPTCM